MIEDAWDQALLRRLKFKPLPELEAGPESGMCEVRSDMWVIVHPERGVVFFDRPGWSRHSIGLGSIQGNRMLNFAEHHRDSVYPGALVVHTRRIFIPIDLSDYR